MAHKKTFPTLSEETLKICPYGDPRCSLCQLSLEALKDIHFQRFNNKLSIDKVREYMRDTYQRHPHNTTVANHFKHHCLTDKKAILKSEAKSPIIMDVILARQQALDEGKNTELLDSAYDQMVRMAADTTQAVDTMYKALREKFKDPKTILDEMEKMEAAQLLKLLGELNAIASTQIKTVAALRAPKTVVLSFLEDTLNKAVMEVNQIVSDLFMLFQDEMNKMLTAQHAKHLVTDALFRDVYKMVAVQYKEKMIDLRRDQLARAQATLLDLERII